MLGYSLIVLKTEFQSQFVILKTQKWYLIPHCLKISIVRYRSRVSIKEKELNSPLHLCLVATKKGVFGSHSTTVS